MKYAATFSGVALAASISTLMYVDRQNDQDLIEADRENDALLVQATEAALAREAEVDAALELARCETSAEARALNRAAFGWITGQLRESTFKTEFIAWLERCIPERDCAASLVAIPIPDDCASTLPASPATPDG